MMAEKRFLKNIKPVVKMIADVDKEFVKQHGREVIEEAVRYQQSGVKIQIMSKMKKKAFEDKFRDDVVKMRFDDAAEKLDQPKKQPIPNKSVELDKDVYTSTSIDLATIPHMH